MLYRQANALRQIAGRLNVPPLRDLLKQPGVNEALRVTVLHHTGEQPHSVATLRRQTGSHCSLQVIYERLPRPLDYEFAIPLERYQKLLTAFRLNRFDTMDDEPTLPWTGVDLWLVERGSGSFYHDVVLSPSNPSGHHREILLALRQQLPEALRPLAL